MNAYTTPMSPIKKYVLVVLLQDLQDVEFVVVRFQVGLKNK